MTRLAANMTKGRERMLPALLQGGARGIRTPDLFHAMEARYQLRHSPGCPARAGTIPHGWVVDAGGLKPNTWQRFERLGTAWEQVKIGLGDEPQEAVEGEPEVVANPRRRARTPLTDSQVDAIRTARANGESVVSISRRFGVHRMTVWTHTKDLLS